LPIYVYLALDNDLEIIPVMNKIDLPNADPERVALELEEVIGIDKDEVILASAKDNIGIEVILERIVETIPPPSGDRDAPLKALVVDYLYHSYRGVVAYVCVKERVLKDGDQIKMMATGQTYEGNEVGVFTPKAVQQERHEVVDVGYLTASIKNIS